VELELEQVRLGAVQVQAHLVVELEQVPIR